MTEKPNERPEDKKPVQPDETGAQKEELEQVDEMEKESMYELQSLREANNEANDDAVNDAEQALKKIFEDMRRWIRENGDPEVVKERLEKGRQDIAKVLTETRDSVIALANSEQFKNTVEAGKEFVVGTGSMIADGVKYGADQLMKNPTINRVVTDVDSKLDSLRENENLKEVVNSAEDAMDKLNAAIFNGIRSFFSKPQTGSGPEETAAPAETEEPAVTEDKDLPAVRTEQRPAVTDQPDKK